MLYSVILVSAIQQRESAITGGSVLKFRIKASWTPLKKVGLDQSKSLPTIRRESVLSHLLSSDSSHLPLPISTAPINSQNHQQMYPYCSFSNIVLYLSGYVFVRLVRLCTT